MKVPLTLTVPGAAGGSGALGGRLCSEPALSALGRHVCVEVDERIETAVVQRMRVPTDDAARAVAQDLRPC